MRQDSFPSSDFKRKYKNKLICKKCKSGSMLPAIQEGEPEYTDNFICEGCQYHDTIPTKETLFNQISTGVLGLIFSTYLFITHLSGLFSGIQHENMKYVLQDAGLTTLSTAFFLGFLYILFRAYLGIDHRREYSPVKTTDSV